MVDPTLQNLFSMFYPLTNSEQREWAAILELPEGEYLAALEREARDRGLRQSTMDGVAIWSDEDGRELVLLFRVRDPGILDDVRGVYGTIARHDAPEP